MMNLDPTGKRRICGRCKQDMKVFVLIEKNAMELERWRVMMCCNAAERKRPKEQDSIISTMINLCQVSKFWDILLHLL